MAGVSKNARSGKSSQTFYHACGGEIKMKSIFSNGKLKNQAYCVQCGKTARRPKELMAQK
ncbi:MAG: hypothetical protein ACOC3V_03270 [bacterium]